MGYVYFLKHKNMSPVKIGMTNGSIEKRIAQIQTGSPYGVELIGFIETNKPKTLESKLHTLLDEARLNGEWFDIDLIRAKVLLEEHTYKLDESKMIKFDIPLSFDHKKFKYFELVIFKCFFDSLPLHKEFFDVNKIRILLESKTDIVVFTASDSYLERLYNEYYDITNGKTTR